MTEKYSDTYEMIERVAKAIRDSEEGVGSSEPWEAYRDDAMAAIRAMRLPRECAFVQDIKREAFNEVIDRAVAEFPRFL